MLVPQKPRRAPASAADPHTRLTGWALPLVRAAWLVTAGAAVALFIAGLPTYTAQVQPPCIGSICSEAATAEVASALAQLGLTVPAYAALQLILLIVSALAWGAVAVYIFARRSDDWMTALVSLQLLLQGIESIHIVYDAAAWTWAGLSLLISTLNGVLLFLLIALFPNGRFVPRWFRWLALATVVFLVVDALTYWLTGWSPLHATVPGLLAWFGLALAFVGGQIYRYFTASNPVQRQQTKWIVSAIAFIIGSQLALLLPGLFNPRLLEAGSAYAVVVGLFFELALLSAPVAVAFAVLKHRLYDVDLIINRTLVYGLLTATLAVLYLGAVALLQGALRALTGQASQLAIVVSTLLIAALAAPLRLRLQNLIDRRFYRRKYNAAETIAAFGVAARDEVELDHLSERLLDVVERTMQPAHAGLWLSPPSGPDGQR